MDCYVIGEEITATIIERFSLYGPRGVTLHPVRDYEEALRCIAEGSGGPSMVISSNLVLREDGLLRRRPFQWMENYRTVFAVGRTLPMHSTYQLAKDQTIPLGLLDIPILRAQERSHVGRMITDSFGILKETSLYRDRTLVEGEDVAEVLHPKVAAKILAGEEVVTVCSVPLLGYFGVGVKPSS